MKLDRENREYDPELEKENQDVEENESRKDGRKIAVLAGAGALAAVLLIAGCVKGCGSNKGKNPDSMQAVFEQYLEEDGNAFDAGDTSSEDAQADGEGENVTEESADSEAAEDFALGGKDAEVQGAAEKAEVE